MSGRSIAMVKRAPMARPMSRRRQQTLLHDRRRTRAICAYLVDHRESLVNELEGFLGKTKMDKNKKRKELERLARKHFNEASESQQRIYYDRVRDREDPSESVGETEEEKKLQSAGQGEQPLVEFRSVDEGEVEFRSAGEGAQPLVEFRSAGESSEQPLVELGEKQLGFRSSDSVEFRSAGDVKADTPLRTPERSVTTSELHDAVGLPTPKKVPRRLFKSTPAPMSTFQSAAPSSGGLNDALMREHKALRSLYGDAAALETMACAMRILEVVDMKQWKIVRLSRSQSWRAWLQS